MATQVKLAASVRTGLGRTAVRKIKSEGMIPAVVYSAGGKAQALQVPAEKLSSVLSHAIGENFLVDLEIKDGSSTSSTLALMQEVQHHPVTREILHVDFHAVKANEAVTAEVPIEPKGEPRGVKQGGGVLEQLIHELEVECLPTDLPDQIVVDVSALEIGDHVTVADLNLPKGVTAIPDAEMVVFLVSAPRVAEEETPTEAAPTSPEVIREKKETPAEE